MLGALNNAALVVKTYAENTASFYYHGLYTKQCSKKQRKKAKKNFHWYRNAALLGGIAMGVKWKVDRFKQDMEHAFKQKKNEWEKSAEQFKRELPNHIVQILNTDYPEIEDALSRKLGRMAKRRGKKIAQGVDAAIERGCHAYLNWLGEWARWLNG